jgi:hypothetical protein
MKLDYAFLATAADRFKDGRICVFGGDFDNIQASAFPVTLVLTVVVKFLVFPNEPLEGHTLRLDVERPEGTRIAGDPSSVNTIRNQLDASAPSGASVLAQIAIELASEGKYSIHIVVDDEQVRTLPLWASKVSEAEQTR